MATLINNPQDSAVTAIRGILTGAAPNDLDLDSLREKRLIKYENRDMIRVQKVVNEQRIPLEISKDPFYSEENIRHLENVMRDIKDGNSHFAEHDLVEVE
jgi:hypothetical protein